MRKTVALFAVFFLLTSCAFAANGDIGKRMACKAKIGAINLTTGLWEIPAQTLKGYHKGCGKINKRTPAKVAGAMIGLVRGIQFAAGRTIWGALDLFGFWTANPKDNHGVGIPLDAKYAWEEGVQYDIRKPTLLKGIKPIERKVVHGAADTLLGIAEVPSQMSKANRCNENPLKGFARGVWYFISREIYGVANLATFILPNPTENKGQPFNGKWAWSQMSECKAKVK